MLLTDEEIVEAINNGRKSNKRDGRDGIVVKLPPEYIRDKKYCLKAQHKKTVEWFIEEIEKHIDPKLGCIENDGSYTLLHNARVLIKEKEWQAIKDKAREV